MILLFFIFFSLFIVHASRGKDQRFIIQFLDEKYRQITSLLSLPQSVVQMFAFDFPFFFLEYPAPAGQYIFDFTRHYIVFPREFINNAV